MRMPLTRWWIALCILCVVLVAGPALLFAARYNSGLFPTPTVASLPFSTPLPTQTPERREPARSAPATLPSSPEQETVLIAPAPSPSPPARGPQVLTLLGSPQGVLTLDPALVQDADSAFVIRQIFRGLIDFDDHLMPIPALAQQVRISADQLTYTITLRDKLTFQDGTPLTARDVKYSFERATDPALVGGDGRKLPAWNVFRDLVGAEDRMLGRRNDIPGIRIINDQTLEIQLTRPSPTLLLRLATPPAFIVSQANVETGPNWWKHPNGSGPFRVAQWSDRLLVLEGVPSYRPSPPILHELRIKLGLDALDPVTQYEQGQIDLADVPLNELDRILAPRSPYRNQLQMQPLFEGNFLFINPALPPFTDPAVRRALVQAIDVTKLVHVTLQDRVVEAKGIVPAGVLGQDWTASLVPFDPAAASSILHAVTASAPLELSSGGSDVLVVLAKALERDIHVPVYVLNYDWPDYLADLSHHRFACFLVSWLADYPDPEAFLSTLFRSDSPDNMLGYNDPQIDALLDRASHSTDPLVRVAIYRAVQQQLLDAAIVVPLYQDVAYILVQPRVHGLPLTPLGILGLERVWIAGS